eukprot:scaffold326353_cov55-Tisochrysis_lutea.AAC.10
MGASATKREHRPPNCFRCSAGAPPSPARRSRPRHRSLHPFALHRQMRLLARRHLDLQATSKSAA